MIFKATYYSTLLEWCVGDLQGYILLYIAGVVIGDLHTILHCWSGVLVIFKATVHTHLLCWIGVLVIFKASYYST